ncbi:MAG: hypothetical protein ABSE49_04530 [Polyangiaceae bacterium]
MAAEVPVAVYPAMLVGTMVGSFVGMGLDVALGSRSLWSLLACSVVLEALVGARYAAARMGEPLTPVQRRRLSIHYSLALVSLSLPTWVWLTSSRVGRLELPSVSLLEAGLAVLGVVAGTAARYGLMGLFSPAPSRRPA